MKSQSKTLEAALTILSASPDLEIKVRPYVDATRQEIRFFEIHSLQLSTGERAAVRFAAAIWFGSDAIAGDTFQFSQEMERRLKLAVIRGLKIYWRLV